MAQEVATATSLDIDYDATSRAVILTASWPSAPDTEGWSEEVTLPHNDSTVEIGVLSHEPNADPEDIQFGGFLTVLGQDAAPSTSSPYPPNPAHPPTNPPNRSNTIPNHNPSLPPPRHQLPLPDPTTPPPNLHNLFLPANRPPPHAHPLLPQTASHAPRPLMQATHTPHPPLFPLHRQIPIQRRPLPLLPAPHAPRQSRRRHRSRSPRLGRPSMGKRSAIPSLASHASACRLLDPAPRSLLERLHTAAFALSPCVSDIACACPAALARRLLGLSCGRGGNDGGKSV